MNSTELEQYSTVIGPSAHHDCAAQDAKAYFRLWRVFRDLALRPTEFTSTSAMPHTRDNLIFVPKQIKLHSCTPFVCGRNPEHPKENPRGHGAKVQIPSR